MNYLLEPQKFLASWFPDGSKVTSLLPCCWPNLTPRLSLFYLPWFIELRRHVDEIGPGDEVVCGLSQTFVMSLERSFFGTVCNSHIYFLKAYYYSEILGIVKVSKFNLMLN